MRRSNLALLLMVSLVAVGSCKDDVDYVRVVVQSSEPNLGASLDLQVALSGGGKSSGFQYRAQLTRPPPDLSDFTVTFASGVSEVDIRTITRPSGQSLDWGGDLHVSLPGAGRTLPLQISAGEQSVKAIAPQDGDTQSIAVYGAEAALAWPTTSGKVQTVPVTEDRVAAGTDRLDELGVDAKKIRVTSRPSASFNSELFVTSWIDSGLHPVVRSEIRNEQTPKIVTVDDLPGIIDYHVAVDPAKMARLPIVSAALTDNRVVVYGHDLDGNVVQPRIESPALTPLTGLLGIVVTPNETVALVVKGNGSRLIQISMKNDATLGTKIAEQTLVGTPVAMSLNADGSRIVVATVSDFGDPEKGALSVQTFSAVNPSPTHAPVAIARYPFTAGDPAGGVALSSCAIAWPQKRADGTGVTDVWYTLLDLGQQPTGTPHLAHVAQDGHHWAPSLACFSQSRVLATMFAGASPRAPTATLVLRRLPTE